MLCDTCQRPIDTLAGPFISLDSGEQHHPQCFVCTECQLPLSDGVLVRNKEGRPFHGKCYEKVAPRCAGCTKPIIGDQRRFHADCFTCHACNERLATQYSMVDGHFYHGNCYAERLAPRCAACAKPIAGDQTSVLLDDQRRFHSECFTCHACNERLAAQYNVADGHFYHAGCYTERLAPRCTGCQKPIASGSAFVNYNTAKYHDECFRCAKCATTLSGVRFRVEPSGGTFTCGSCVARETQERVHSSEAHVKAPNFEETSSESHLPVGSTTHRSTKRSSLTMADKDINESQLANPSSPTKANKSHHGLTASSSTINSPARKLEVSPKHNVPAQMQVTSSTPSSSVSLQSVDTHQRRPAALATSTKAEPTPMSPTGRASQSLHQMALDGSSSHAISARKFALGVRDERLGKVQTGSTRVPVGAITHRATSPLKSHDETPAVQAEVSSGRTASSVAPHETASTSVTTGALAAKAPSAGDLASRLPIVDLTASRFPPPPSPMSASPTRLSTQEGAGPQPPLPPPPPPLFVLNSSDGSQPHLERKPTASNVSTDNAPIPSSLLDAIRGASKSQLRKVSLSVSSVPNKNGSNALPPLFRSASLSLSTPLKPDLQSELRAKLTQKRGSIESSKRPTDDDSGSDWA